MTQERHEVTAEMPHDAFARLAIALRSAALDGQLRELTTAADNRRLRNVLLDACGSDHRPLVELLMAVADDVRPMLVAAHTGNVPWESRRAPIVHRLVATRYLQQDMARWAIDVWAYADGVRDVIPEAPALPVVVSSHTDAHTGATTARASSAAGAVQPGWARAKTSARGAPVAAAFTGAGSGAATAPSRRTSAPTKTWGWRSARAPMSAAELARIQRMERVSYTVLIGAVLIGFFAEAYALMSRPVERDYYTGCCLDCNIARYRSNARCRASDTRPRVDRARQHADGVRTRMARTCRWHLSGRTHNALRRRRRWL